MLLQRSFDSKVIAKGLVNEHIVFDAEECPPWHSRAVEEPSTGITSGNHQPRSWIGANGAGRNRRLLRSYVTDKILEHPEMFQE